MPIYNQFPAENVKNSFTSDFLNSNEIFGSIMNMIIGQVVFADAVGNTKYNLADKFRIDGSMYGDTKLFYASDVLGSRPWGNIDYAEAENLLATKKPEDPKMQAVSIDQFKMITVTVDNYLSKRAWSTEGAFATFHGVILARIRQTKNIHDETLINQFIGCEKVPGEKTDITITVPGGGTEADNRIAAQTIAKRLADLLADMADISRDYNEYGFMRNYDPSELMVIWNVEQHNKILKLDVPTIFHKDGLFDAIEEHNMPARYFGKVNTSPKTVGASNITTRAATEFYVDAGGNVDTDYERLTNNIVAHYFAGELVKEGNYPSYFTYDEDPNIAFKVIHKDSIPFMSAFESATSFFNPRSLSENHYLIWGYASPCHLKNYPWVTATIQVAEEE